MKVADYMTPHPLTITERESVRRIAELIRVHGVHQLPVVDTANRLVGIVTDRDIRSVGRSGESGYLAASDIMTSDVITTIPAADLAEAVDLLCQNGFGALPVVVGESVVGIITTRDLLRKLKELLDDDAVKGAAHALSTFEADPL
jgi:CBS domain-containing protein